MVFRAGVVQVWVWDLRVSTESRPTVTLALILKEKETVFFQRSLDQLATRVQNCMAAASAGVSRRKVRRGVVRTGKGVSWKTSMGWREIR